MNRPAKLTGYELLCRMHVVLGHPGLATMLNTLGLMKETKGMISKTDIEKFVRRKCGLCESMLMNTPAFRPSTTLSPAPEPGQVWTRDTLKFRVAQFHLNSFYSQLSTCTLGNKGRPFFDDVRLGLAFQCFIECREQIHHTGGFTVEFGRGLHPSNLSLRDWDFEKRKQHVLIAYGISITTSILMHFGRRAAKDEAARFAVEPELDEVASKMHQLGSCLHC